MAGTLGVPGDVGYTCETAEYFDLEHIQSRIEKYYVDLHTLRRTAAENGGIDQLAAQKAFPFHSYFMSAPQPVFNGESLETDLETVEGCFRHLRKLFDELSDYRFNISLPPSSSKPIFLERLNCSARKVIVLITS